MGWRDYGGVDQATGGIGVYGDDLPDAPHAHIPGYTDAVEQDSGLLLPPFLDQSRPVPNFVGESVSVVSKNVGWDTTTVSWTSSKAFQAYRFEQVANAGSPVFSGTLLASGVTSNAAPNQVPNPSFEYNPAGQNITDGTWSGGNDAGSAFLAPAIQQQDAASGVRSWRLPCNIGANGFAGVWPLTWIPVVAGPFTLGCAFTAYNLPQSVYILIRTYVYQDQGVTAASGGSFDWYGSIGWTNNDGWPQIANGSWLTYTTNLPTDARYVAVYAYVVDYSGVAHPGVDWAVDAMAAYQSPSWPGYFDGDSPGWVWSGTPGNSVSYPMGIAGATNRTNITGEAMSGVDATDTIKIFVQDYAGNWST